MIIVVTALHVATRARLPELKALSCVLGRDGNALALVMQKWTEHQMELNGVFETNLSTMALSLLLASRRTELASIQVQHPKQHFGLMSCQ